MSRPYKALATKSSNKTLKREYIMAENKGLTNFIIFLSEFRKNFSSWSELSFVVVFIFAKNKLVLIFAAVSSEQSGHFRKVIWSLGENRSEFATTFCKIFLFLFIRNWTILLHNLSALRVTLMHQLQKPIYLIGLFLWKLQNCS